MSIVIPRTKSKTLYICGKYYVIARNNKPETIRKAIEKYERELKEKEER